MFTLGPAERVAVRQQIRDVVVRRRTAAAQWLIGSKVHLVHPQCQNDGIPAQAGEK